jgi:hypothetical protein
VIALVRETVDGLGELVAQHIKLARLEFAADLQSLGRRAGVLAVFMAFSLIGYALVMVGIAASVGGVTTIGTSLLAIGLVHVAGGATGVFRVVARSRAKPLMDATGDEMSRSLAALGSATALPAAIPHGPERIHVR